MSKTNIIPNDAKEFRYLSQARYAAFSTELQSAMKIAAKRWGWDKATWMMQTELVADAFSRYTEAELMDCYRNLPPDLPDEIEFTE